MGIQGLWQIVEAASETISLEELEGKKVAVDVSLWLYQAQSGFSPDTLCPHVNLLIRRLAKLVFYRIRPVFVFDGPSVPPFKRRVLEERSLRRHADDIVLNVERRRQLQQLAESDQQPETVQKVLTQLRSPQKRRKQREEENLFQLPSTSRQIMTLDEDEIDDSIEDEDNEVIQDDSILDDVMALTARRETLRAQRLKPGQVPIDSMNFSNFQLQRLLGRNKLNERIDELKRARQGERVIMCSKEGRKREHIIEWDEDDDCTVIEEKKKTMTDMNKRGMQLTLDYLTESTIEKEEEKMKRDEEEDVQKAIALSLADRGTVPKRHEWLSKSGLLEEVQRRRAQNERRGISLSSSDTDSDDFIDVPMDETTEEKKHEDDDSQQPSTSTATRNDEWNPALKEDGDVIGTMRNIEGKGHEQSGTPEQYRELQEVLSACGFPWIEAPGEAEAQCVWLQNEGLVDGVVSDDSDCIAFGVGRLIRYLFSKEKDIQYYEGDKVHKELGLSRWDAITVAMLSGGDYACGLKGVGVVVALEIMAQFTERREEGEEETLNRLQRIEDWLLREGEYSTAVDTADRRRLRGVVERVNGRENIRGLSSRPILNAYAHPLVDESKEQFKWRSVRMDVLRKQLWLKLQWNEERVEKSVQDAFIRWNAFMAGENTYQTHMTSFFRRAPLSSSVDVDMKKTLSSRVVTALYMMTEKRTLPMELVLENRTEEKKEDMKRPPIRGRGRGRVKRGGMTIRREQLKLSSSSSSSQSE